MVADFRGWDGKHETVFQSRPSIRFMGIPRVSPGAFSLAGGSFGIFFRLLVGSNRGRRGNDLDFAEAGKPRRSRLVIEGVTVPV
jgi:hypothetical protein